MFLAHQRAPKDVVPLCGVLLETRRDAFDLAGDRLPIDTTRLELLPACVALVAHLDDRRYRPLFGRTARTPLFGVEIPILAHHRADPEKGSGIAMICTFGDLTDVTWWRELALPTRTQVVLRVCEEDPRGLGRLTGVGQAGGGGLNDPRPE